MKTETKFLIVAIIMILSVGPMSYFFMPSANQIVLPDENQTATAHVYAGNASGTIMGIQPYIYYVGIAGFNNATAVRSIVDSIPDIVNSSVDVSLNPNGAGYQYTIVVPLNDSSQAKEIGFRLAWRFTKIFQQLAGSIPYVFGRVELPQNFTIVTADGVVNATAPENYTVQAMFLYSRTPGSNAQVYCPQFTTSLANLLVKTSSLCFDTQLMVNQPYLGLSALEVVLAEQKSAVIGLEADAIVGIRFNGTYRFASEESVSLPALENETGSQITRSPSAENLSIGSFAIEAEYKNASETARIKAIFARNNFTIENEYKIAEVLLPSSLEIGDSTYEFYATPYTTGLIGMSDGIGSYSFNVSVRVIYGEITGISVKKIGLS